jgi:hypothetical protein
MSGCNMLEQVPRFPAETCSYRRQHYRLQHAQTGSNMPGCNMLEKVALCPPATCSNRVAISLAATCPNRLQHHVHFITTSCAVLSCPATLPSILNGHEGHHHLWSLPDPAPRLRSGLGKNSLTCEDNPFIHQSGS